MVELCCCWILNRFWNTLRIRHNSIWSLGVSFHRSCLVYFFLHRLNYFRFSNISYTLTEWHALYLLLLFHWWEEKKREEEEKKKIWGESIDCKRTISTYLDTWISSQHWKVYESDDCHVVVFIEHSVRSVCACIDW